MNFPSLLVTEASSADMIHSINSNAIPAVAWMLIEILQRPALFDQIQRELDIHTMTNPQTGLRELPPESLTECSTLDSVYHEVLRLRSYSVSVRQVREGFLLENFIIRPGHLIMCPAWLPQQQPANWDVGSLPADMFAPERFTQLAQSKAAEARGYLPYGVGHGMCPGRKYAMQEMLAAAAHVIVNFDLEAMCAVDAAGKRLGDGNHIRPAGTEARGIVKPDGDLLVRMRRRTA